MQTLSISQKISMSTFLNIIAKHSSTLFHLSNVIYKIINFQILEMVRFMSVPSPAPEKLISLTVCAKTACDYDYQS